MPTHSTVFKRDFFTLRIGIFKLENSVLVHVVLKEDAHGPVRRPCEPVVGTFLEDLCVTKLLSSCLASFNVGVDTLRDISVEDYPLEVVALVLLWGQLE